MRRIVLVVSILLFALAPMPVAHASVSETITITTLKPLGPVDGSFATSGAFVDVGVLTTLNLHFSAIPAPDHLITHPTLRFKGDNGSFTVKAQIRETPTSNPQVFADTGVWEIVDGTGAYAKLHGGGTLVGTVDDDSGVVNRTYSGKVHFD
ncbi:MAG: hypothetical protein U0893_04825 [Chloroflexota bacterium]